VAAERTTTPASNTKILTAIRRRERKRIRVILPEKSAKGALRTSNIYDAIEPAAQQCHSGRVSKNPFAVNCLDPASEPMSVASLWIRHTFNPETCP
jgi:hypothetical protein